MKCVVLLKQTFDTEEKIQLKDGQISDEGVTYIINPYDEYALEEAIQIKEKHGGEVLVLSVGSQIVEKSMRTALAMGADRGILIEEPAEADESLVATLLAQVVKEEGYDLLLAGHVTIDNGASQVAARVAEQLDLPQLSAVLELEIEGETIHAQLDIEGDVAEVEASLPCLVTAQQGLNEPRYPSLPGIMKAKRKPLRQMSYTDLLKDSGMATKIQVKKLKVSLPPAKKAGRLLEGELPEQVAQLVDLLKERGLSE
jgi:electron transfer flavoprotein beta subunit